jgi:hypothetical protein
MGAGPILIFDKSALQGLSTDESVMLDQFFLVNLVPIFFIETLADLQKVDPRGRSADAVVRDLAGKTPDRPFPNVFHRTLLIANLLGDAVPMTGQIALARGVAKRDAQGGISVVVDEAPEAEAVRRWQTGEFSEIERLYARAWRASLTQIDFTRKIDMARRLVRPDQRIVDLKGARRFADAFVSSAGREVMMFAMQFLDIPDEYVGAIDSRYAAAGRPAFSEFAPYAAFAMAVDLVFYLGMGIGQIGEERRSNVIDLSYLYYLPFCMLFTSRDKLHRRLAPMFMRPRQRFVWAGHLKAELRALNEHFAHFREEIETQGLLAYAHEPPSGVSPLISELWEHCLLLDGRDRSEPSEEMPAPSSDELLERIKRIAESGEVPNGPGVTEPDSVILRSRMSMRRGSWRLLPRGIEGGTE